MSLCIMVLARGSSAEGLTVEVEAPDILLLGRSDGDKRGDLTGEVVK